MERGGPLGPYLNVPVPSYVLTRFPGTKESLPREAGDVPRPRGLRGSFIASKELLLPPLIRGSVVSPQEAKRGLLCPCAFLQFDPDSCYYHPKFPQPVPSLCSSREDDPGPHWLSPCDDLKGWQFNQVFQLLWVIQVLQILAILGGRRRSLSVLFFLGHGGTVAGESLKERRGSSLGQSLAAKSQAAVSS